MQHIADYLRLIKVNSTPLPEMRLRLESSGIGFEPVLTGISFSENLENTLFLGILEPDDKKDLPSDGGPSTASMVNKFNILLSFI